MHFRSEGAHIVSDNPSCTPEDKRSLWLQQEQGIRELARHCLDISNEQLWALLEELDLVRKERGQQHVAKNAVLFNLDHPDVGRLFRLGVQMEKTEVSAELARLRREIGDFRRAKSDKAERRQTITYATRKGIRLMTMPTINIWINQAGSPRVHAIRMLHSNPDGWPVKVFATRTDTNNPSQSFADVGGTEPSSEVPDEEYAQFAVDYVQANNIRAILPTDRMAALATRRTDFTALGCVLMSAGPEVAAMAHSKAATYERASALGVRVPPYRLVHTPEQFRDAVIAIRSTGHTACVKPDTGFAAFAFRIVIDTALSMENLLAPVKPVIDMETYAAAMEKALVQDEVLPPFIVMPYLDEPEISVDKLTSTSGRSLLAISRAKQRWYREFPTDHPEILEMADALASRLPLPYFSNIQFRFLDGEPVLLEVNDRVSGGIDQTEATGVNAYWEGVRYAVTGEERELVPHLGGRVFLQQNTVPL